MATTKTLAPTNQTITIAAFQGEKPDHRQVADAEGKLADAVNALNSQIMYEYDSGITFNSLATLSTLLNNALTNSSNKRKLLRFACNGTFDCFYTGVSYFVDLKVSSTSYSSCIMQGVGYDSLIVGTLSNGTWSFVSITSQKVTGKTFTITSGNPLNITMANNSRITLLCSSAYNSHSGIINLSCSNSGDADFFVLVGASGLTLSKSGATVTITATNGVNGTAIIHAGSIS